MSASIPAEKAIFLEALEIGELAERALFLDRSCTGNEQLRADVEALLSSHNRSLGLLDATSASLVPGARDSVQIGPYKLLKQIGEGGMGVVYVAEQHKPVKRRVAVKVIKPGMDSQQVIARFEAERQALSLMDHPNIAKVLDAGTTDSGRPYFVMELVKGQPITQYCDEKHAAPRQRLELFLCVCQAIQHAHQKGIIHRDMKPSNVLVAEYDQNLVPKVIDFGVAKAIGQALTETTMFTGLGQIVGTLEYMSPEQARVNQFDIDTRSDVYSLGVLLYELLTGSTPLEKERLRAAGWDEMLRIIREEEPEKPSTRLSRVGRPSTHDAAADPRLHSATYSSLASIAAVRSTEPAKLTKLVRGELDWIVMKALEKDRACRYQTANGLAADVERYLKDEPVQACPPSAMYRFRKFARRNQTTLVMASFVAAALVVGTVVSTWQAIRAERSLVETEHQRSLADANFRQAERQRALAESSYKQARKAVDQLFVHIGDDVTLNQPEFQPLRAELLQSALRYYQEFIETWKDEPAKQAEIATSYRRVADLTQQIGAQPQAQSAYQEALLLQKGLADHGESKRKNDVASTTMMLGRSQQSAGNYHDAARSYEEALSLYRELAEKEPQEVRYQDGIASTLNNLGYLSSEREKLEEAIKYHEEAVAIHQRLVNDEPENAGRKYRLSVSYGNLGNRLTLLSRFNDALAAHNKRLVLLRELAQQHGLRKEYDEQFGDTFNNIGDVYRQNRSEPGWFENGIAAYTESRAIQERIVKDHPKSLQAQSKLANTLINTGQVYEWHKDHVEALQAFDVATVLLEKIVGTNPQGANDLSSLGMSYARKGRALVALARKEEAVAPYEKAVASHKRLVGLVPSNQRYKQELDSFQRELARAKK